MAIVVSSSKAFKTSVAMNKKIRKLLISFADEKYKQFSSKLVRGKAEVLGVRVPQLRVIARDIVKGNWRDYVSSTDVIYMEEVMLQGMVIGYTKMPIEEILKYVENFVPKISNWAVCDTFCSGLQIVKNHRNLTWEFLRKYLVSSKEFDVRFAVVMLLAYFDTEDYVEQVLCALDTINHEGYYAKMAVAWALSLCFVNFPEVTMAHLKNSKLDAWTYNKTLQKICESRKVDQQTKVMIRSMKR